MFAEHDGLTDALALSGEHDESSVAVDALDDQGGAFVVGEDRAHSPALAIRGRG